MKCSQCGLDNRPDARFCKRCGQSLHRSPAEPPQSQPPTICPACGATAKSRSHFCPRCGKPLPSRSAQPSPTVDDTAPMPSSSITQPYVPPSPIYAHPPVQPPPPTTPPAAARSTPRWIGWVAASVALLCIAVLVVTAIVFGPRLLGDKAPTAEATLAFDARVTITASSAEVRVGDPLTVTVTITNAGQTTFGNLRYQLGGEWQQFLAAPTGSATHHEVDVPPTGSDAATFVLEAAQAGTAQIHANVTVDTRDPPATRPVASEYVVEISIVQ